MFFTKHFEYDGVQSRQYGLFFGHIDTSPIKRLYSELSLRTAYYPSQKSHAFYDAMYDESPLSFEVEILRDTPIREENEKKTITEWLFREHYFRKLRADYNEDQNVEWVSEGESPAVAKRLYINCSFINPEEIRYSGNLFGWKCTCVCSDIMARQDAVEIMIEKGVTDGTPVLDWTNKTYYTKSGDVYTATTKAAYEAGSSSEIYELVSGSYVSVFDWTNNLYGIKFTIPIVGTQIDVPLTKTYYESDFLSSTILIYPNVDKDVTFELDTDDGDYTYPIVSFKPMFDYVAIQSLYASDPTEYAYIEDLVNEAKSASFKNTSDNNRTMLLDNIRRTTSLVCDCSLGTITGGYNTYDVSANKKFLRLIPGSNTIHITGIIGNIKIKYSPARFLV